MHLLHAILTGIVTVLPATRSTQEGSPPPALFIVGATVLEVETGEFHPFRTVKIAGDRVVAVGAASELLPEAEDRVIEARGAVLVPGLAEMHGHLPREAQGREFAEDVLFLYLSHGITTVRGMLGDAQQLELREAVRSGQLDGPRLIVGSPPMTGGSTTTPEEAREQVAAYAAAGYEHLKVHEALSPEVYDAICESAREAHLSWSGHVSDYVGLANAMAKGQSTVDHLDNFLESTLPAATQKKYEAGMPPIVLADEADPSRFGEIARSIATAGTAIIPTMVIFDTLYSGREPEEIRLERVECRYLPKAIVDAWVGTFRQYAAGQAGDSGPRIAAHRRAALTALHEAGARILLGTDSPQIFSVPGFSLRREVALMVECGMTPLAVIQSGTLEVHRYFGSEEPFGARVGARADFTLVRGNPLIDVGALFDVEAVVFGGRIITRAEIDARLETIAAKNR